MKKKLPQAKQQLRLAVCSNAGGSGKTTLAVHLGYEVARLGYAVVLIELDANNSFDPFLGVKPSDLKYSSACVLKEGFSGEYPLVPLWQDLCARAWGIPGGPFLDAIATELTSYRRREYALADRLSDKPLEVGGIYPDLIIFDTPAALEPFGLLALAAATHVITAIKAEYKDLNSVNRFIEWYYSRILELRLKPEPKLMGIVPSMVDFGEANHRNLLGRDKKGNLLAVQGDTLEAYCQTQQLTCFPPIKKSSYFVSSTSARTPVHLYAPGCPATKSFTKVTAAIVEELNREV